MAHFHDTLERCEWPLRVRVYSCSADRVSHNPQSLRRTFLRRSSASPRTTRRSSLLPFPLPSSSPQPLPPPPFAPTAPTRAWAAFPSRRSPPSSGKAQSRSLPTTTSACSTTAGNLQPLLRQPSPRLSSVIKASRKRQRTATVSAASATTHPLPSGRRPSTRRGRSIPSRSRRALARPSRLSRAPSPSAGAA